MYSVEIATKTQLTNADCKLIAELMNEIPEFDVAASIAEIEQRLSNKAILLQLIKVEGEIAGFKLGYALTDNIFYSWLGGILPDFRKLGLARKLLTAQEDWAKQQGYNTIEVKTRNCFPAMLNMLIGHRYQITTMEAHAEDSNQHRLYLQKAI